jgi:hypothetical protein
MLFKDIGIKNGISNIFCSWDLIIHLFKYDITWYDDQFVKFFHQLVSFAFKYM